MSTGTFTSPSSIKYPLRGLPDSRRLHDLLRQGYEKQQHVSVVLRIVDGSEPAGAEPPSVNIDVDTIEREPGSEKYNFSGNCANAGWIAAASYDFDVEEGALEMRM